MGMTGKTSGAKERDDEPRSLTAPVTGVVVFTDLVGSTEQRIRLGEDVADRLRRIHDWLVVGAMEKRGGFVVKGTGDGFHAVFPSATAACDAAVAIHAALDRYSSSPQAIDELRLRIGISAGDIVWDQVASRSDCFGLAVVEASRLTALCGPGETICAEAVRTLARGRGHHRFEARGLVSLRGFPSPVVTHLVVEESAGGAVAPPAVTETTRLVRVA